jgi:hypothetical protein
LFHISSIVHRRPSIVIVTMDDGRNYAVATTARTGSLTLTVVPLPGVLLT